MRKTIVLLACSAVLIAMLSGCGGTTEEPRSDPTPTPPIGVPYAPSYESDDDTDTDDNTNPNTATNDNTVKDEVLKLLEGYSGEMETGDKIVEKLKEHPEATLEAMSATPLAYREQILMHIGAAMAEARRNDEDRYNEFVTVLDTAEDKELTNQARDMIGFIRANIDHFYNS